MTAWVHPQSAQLIPSDESLKAETTPLNYTKGGKC